MIQRKICLFISLTFIFTHAAAQSEFEQLDIDHACSFFGEESPKYVHTFASEEKAENVVNEILKASGLPKNFAIRAAGVPNATAVVRGSDRFILYNQNFIRDLTNVTGSNWASYSVMAHEIGHHLAGHTLSFSGSRPRLELEADRFSGFILAKLGASLPDSQIAIRSLASSSASKTHPAKHDRLAAIANGWIDACETTDCDSKGNKDKLPKNNPAMLTVLRATPDGYVISNHVARLIQNSLKILGYNPGTVDGVLGEDSMSAIARWQADFNQGHSNGKITRKQIGNLKSHASQFIRSESMNNNSRKPTPSLPNHTRQIKAEATLKEIDFKKLTDKQAYSQIYEQMKNGYCLSAVANFDNAAKVFRKSLYLDNFLYWKAQCQIDLGEFKTAIFTYESLISKYPSSPKYPDSVYKLAELHLNDGAVQKAEPYLEQLLNNYPTRSAGVLAKKLVEQYQVQISGIAK